MPVPWLSSNQGATKLRDALSGLGPPSPPPMSSRHPSVTSSAASTPRLEHHLPPPPHWWHPHNHNHDGGAGEEEEEPAEPRVRLMCSFGGRILPRLHDHQFRYVGGETRIVAVPRFASLSALLAKLVKLLPGGGVGGGDMQVKYQLPHEDLDALISITSDEDVEIMMEEHERLAALNSGAARTPRLRLFLFPSSGGAGGFGSLNDDGDDAGSRRERWFLDALNGGAAAALERGQSEASSVVSELPDYLLGLDSNSDQPEPVHRGTTDPPESPFHPAPSFPRSPVNRPPNDPPEPPTPDLRPLNMKPAGPATLPPVIKDEPVQQAATPGYLGSQSWRYMTEPVPVYFVPASVPQQQAGPVPIPLHVSYGSQPRNPEPVPIVYRHPVQGFNSNTICAGPVYVGGPPTAPPGPLGPYGLPVSVPEGYSFPTIVRGPLGGPGVALQLNPTAGIPYTEELPNEGHWGEQSCL